VKAEARVNEAQAVQKSCAVGCRVGHLRLVVLIHLSLGVFGPPFLFIYRGIVWSPLLIFFLDFIERSLYTCGGIVIFN
jgi:hypothetical protein